MIVLDIESDHPSAGAEPNPFSDRAISIAIGESSASWLETDFADLSMRSRLVNPGFALTRTDIHGITDADVAEALPFRAIARNLLDILNRHQVIVHFNGNRYDVPLLWCEFDRAGIDWDTGAHTFIDLSELWRKCEPRKLGDAVKRFLGREHEGAHTAEADASVLAELLPKMVDLARETNLCFGSSVEEIASVCRRSVKIGGEELECADLGGHLAWRGDTLVFTAHRVRGVAVEDDLGFAGWLARQDWVGPDTKRILLQIAAGQHPARKGKG